jgi:tRNA(fMet)-specific endonuclease VapC
MVVLDTDHLSLLEWAHRPDTARLRARLSELGQDPVAITVVSCEEQIRGWMAYVAKSRTIADQIAGYGRLRTQLQGYCEIQILDFDEIAATIFQRLKQSRIQVGTKDLQIASIVMVHDAILLSRNLKDFRKISGLRVEDWTQEPAA